MPENGRSPFGTLLRKHRLDAGLSQDSLAERAGVSGKTIGALESGARRNPYRETVAALSRALQLSEAERSALSAAATRPLRRRAAPAEEPAHNLPDQLSSFVGRLEVVSEIAALATGNRLVSITGTGGIGKTRIALQVARQLLLMSQGTWFIDLASLEAPFRVAERVASILGLESQQPSMEEALVAALAPQRVLLVFDNCEHVIDEVARLAERLLRACKGVSIVATSRERLNIPSEIVREVPRLDFPEIGTEPVKSNDSSSVLCYDAIRLFIDRATAVAQLTLDAAALPVVASICRRLDGIPLAIELAAARTRDMSLADIAGLLEERFRVLIGGVRTALPRHRTMRASIDWSWDLLSPSEKLVFRQIAIFSGGCTIDAAVRLLEELPKDDLIRDLSALTEKSLVHVTFGPQTRYRLLESTRAYALEKLDLAGQRHSAAERHANWVASFCEYAALHAYDMPLSEWLALTVAELDNIRAALHWSLQSSKSASLPIQIASSVGGLWRFTSLYGEGRTWLTDALKERTNDVRPAILARAWREIAWLGLGPDTVAAAEQAVSLDTMAGDSLDLVLSRRVYSTSLIRAGRPAEARHQLDLAMATLETLQLLRSPVSGLVRTVYGILASERGELAEARSHFEATLSIYLAHHDQLRAATAHFNLAELAFVEGHAQRALDIITSVEPAYKQNRFAFGRASIRANQAAYSMILGNFIGAREAAQDAVRQAQRSQFRTVLLIALQHLATIATLSGDPHRGATLAGYVAAQGVAQHYRRESTEERTFNLMHQALRESLSDDERIALFSDGALLSETAVIELALGC